jgi:hypothetical protein
MTAELWGPRGWGNDRLSAFLRQAEQNKWAVYERHQSLWQASVEIDLLYQQVFEALAYPSNQMSVALFARSVPPWRQSLGMAMSGAYMEAYALLRLALEFSIYAAFLELTPDKIKTWANRDDDLECLKQVRNTFKIKEMTEMIGELLGQKLSAEMRELYDKAITFGAHPNVAGVLVSSAVITDGTTTTLGMIGLHSDVALTKAVIEDVNLAARLGLRCVKGCYKTRLRLAGVEDKLETLVGA